VILGKKKKRLGGPAGGSTERGRNPNNTNMKGFVKDKKRLM